MPVLTPVDRKLNTPPPPYTPEPSESEAQQSTSIPVQVVPTPTFLPKNCEVKVTPAPQNFYDSLQDEDKEEEEDDEEDCKIIEEPPPSKKARIVSLKNEVSAMAARLYQIVEELDDIQKDL